MIFKNINIIYKNKIYTEKEYSEFKLANADLLKLKKIVIKMRRTPKLIFAIMMCLEKNITYIPIDTNYPEERIRYILENSQSGCIFTDDKIIHELTSSNDKKPDFSQSQTSTLSQASTLSQSKVSHSQSQLSQITENEEAYILYTSGTTGNPKGVVIPQKALLNFIDGISEIIEFTPNKKIICLTTVSFDIFFLESIMAIYKGMTVVLADEAEQSNPKLTAELIIKNQIDMLQMTPSRMRLLLNYDRELVFLKNVKDIMIGGEPFPLSLLKVLQEKTNTNIYNMYGPTETTIWSTVSNLTVKDRIDIGKPIKNTQIYITDEKFNILDVGQTGEICIAGAGLAKGYYNMNDLSFEKFVELPEKSSKIYRTGDLGKYLPDGNLEYIGRMDNQVKIRGYRIELEEVEKHINNFKGIQQSAVVVTELGEQILEVFYTCEKEFEIEEFKKYLTEKLPVYMHPSKYTRIEEFKYTPNGKIDRKSIKSFSKDIEVAEKEEILSEIEQKIFETIKYNLDGAVFKNIKMNTILSDIGIDSITFTTIVISLEDEFDFEFEFDMLAFTAFPDIKSIVEYAKSNIN